MRQHRVALLCVTGWYLMGGCSTDTTKSSSDSPSPSPIAQTQEGTDQPPSGEVQERAVPRVAVPGATAPQPAPAPRPIAPGMTTPPLAASPPLSALPGEFAISPLQAGFYLTAVGGGGRITDDAIQTNRTQVQAWEKFRLWLDPTRYHPPPTYHYAIQTAGGNYVTAVDGGGRTTNVLHTDATQPRAWEMFGLSYQGEGTMTYAIQTATGNYLTALGGGGQTTAPAVHTDATQPRAWEMFELWKCGDLGSGYQYRIFSLNGNFLSAMNGGGQTSPNAIFAAPNPFPKIWERFTLLRQADGTYAIQTVNGINYVTAVGGGGLVVSAQTPAILQTDRT